MGLFVHPTPLGDLGHRAFSLYNVSGPFYAFLFLLFIYFFIVCAMCIGAHVSQHVWVRLILSCHLYMGSGGQTQLVKQVCSLLSHLI